MGFIVVRQKGSHVFMQRGEATVTLEHMLDGSGGKLHDVVVNLAKREHS